MRRRDSIHIYTVSNDERLRSFVWLDTVVPWFCVGLGMAILSTLIL